MLLVFVFTRPQRHEFYTRLIKFVQANNFSGPILIMFTVLIESFFFMPTTFLTLGIGLSLQMAQEQSFKAIFMGSLATWTGFWVGINLNAQLLRFLFSSKVEDLNSRNLFVRSVSQVSQELGLNILLIMRSCPIFMLSFIFSPVCLTGISYKDIVLGGISSFIPIVVTVYQGTTIVSEEELANDDFDRERAYNALKSGEYERMQIYTVFRVVGLLISIGLGYGVLIYYSLQKYRATKQLAENQEKASKKGQAEESKSPEEISLSR